MDFSSITQHITSIKHHKFQADTSKSISIQNTKCWLNIIEQSFVTGGIYTISDVTIMGWPQKTLYDLSCPYSSYTSTKSNYRIFGALTMGAILITVVFTPLTTLLTMVVQCASTMYNCFLRSLFHNRALWIRNRLLNWYHLSHCIMKVI